MKAVLEFNLPEDNFDFESCSKGPELVTALWELLNNDLRSKIKYGTDTDVITPNEAEKFKSYLVDYFVECGLMELINKNF